MRTVTSIPVLDKSHRLRRLENSSCEIDVARVFLSFTIPTGFPNWRMKEMDPRWGNKNRRGESASTSRRCIYCSSEVLRFGARNVIARRIVGVPRCKWNRRIQSKTGARASKTAQPLKREIKTSEHECGNGRHRATLRKHAKVNHYPRASYMFTG